MKNIDLDGISLVQVTCSYAKPGKLGEQTCVFFMPAGLTTSAEGMAKIYESTRQFQLGDEDEDPEYWASWTIDSIADPEATFLSGESWEASELAQEEPSTCDSRKFSESTECLPMIPGEVERPTKRK